VKVKDIKITQIFLYSILKFSCTRCNILHVHAWLSLIQEDPDVIYRNLYVLVNKKQQNNKPQRHTRKMLEKSENSPNRMHIDDGTQILSKEGSEHSIDDGSASGDESSAESYVSFTSSTSDKIRLDTPEGIMGSTNEGRIVGRTSDNGIMGETSGTRIIGSKMDADNESERVDTANKSAFEASKPEISIYIVPLNDADNSNDSKSPSSFQGRASPWPFDDDAGVTGNRVCNNDVSGYDRTSYQARCSTRKDRNTGIMDEFSQNLETTISPFRTASSRRFSLGSREATPQPLKLSSRRESIASLWSTRSDGPPKSRPRIRPGSEAKRVVKAFPGLKDQQKAKSCPAVVKTDVIFLWVSFYISFVFTIYLLHTSSGYFLLVALFRFLGHFIL